MQDIAESTMTTKGQVTVPQKARELLGLHAGDRLEWKVGAEGRVEVRKLRARSLSDLVGFLGKPERSASIEEMDEAIRQRTREGNM